MKNYVWLGKEGKFEFVVSLIPKNFVYEFLRKFINKDKLKVKQYFLFLAQNFI